MACFWRHNIRHATSWRRHAHTSATAKRWTALWHSRPPTRSKTTRLFRQENSKLSTIFLDRKDSFPSFRGWATLERIWSGRIRDAFTKFRSVSIASIMSSHIITHNLVFHICSIRPRAKSMHVIVFYFFEENSKTLSLFFVCIHHNWKQRGGRAWSRKRRHWWCIAVFTALSSSQCIFKRKQVSHCKNELRYFAEMKERVCRL